MSSLTQYRRWLTKQVRFTKRSKEGRRMVEKGIQGGVIRNVRRTHAGDVLFEIDFGSAGNPTLSEFSRSAFYLPTGNDNDRPASTAASATN